MTAQIPATVISALDLLPEGTTTGTTGEKRYVASKTSFNNGRSVKVVAYELGGSDYISLNIYKLKGGARLFPCEMSVQKVTAFLLNFKPDQAEA